MWVSIYCFALELSVWTGRTLSNTSWVASLTWLYWVSSLMYCSTICSASCGGKPLAALAALCVSNLALLCGSLSVLGLEMTRNQGGETYERTSSASVISVWSSSMLRGASGANTGLIGEDVEDGFGCDGR